MSAELPDSRAVVGSALRRTAAMGLLAALALLFVGLALNKSGVDLARLRDLALRTSPGLLLLAMVVMTGGMLFMALRWRALMPGARHAPAGALTAIECVGLLLNYALPGPVGELAIAWIVHRRYGVAVAEAIAAGVCSRVLGLSAAGLLAIGAWRFGDMPIPQEYRGLIGGTTALIAALALALIGLAAFPGALIRSSERLVRPLAGRPGRLGGLAGRLDAGLRSVASALLGLRTLGSRAWLEAVFWAFCGHFSVATGTAIAAMSLGLSPDFAGVLFTYCAATAGVIIVFAMPGGQVGWDAMFCSFFLVTTGTELVDALAVTLIVRLQQMLLLLGGALAMPLYGDPLSGSPSPAPAARHP